MRVIIGKSAITWWIAVSLVTLTLLGGGFVFEALSGATYQEQLDRLDTGANIKQEQLTAWLQERQKNVIYHARNPLFKDTLLHWMTYGTPDERNSLSHTLELLVQYHGYAGASVYDLKGQLLLSVGADLPDGPDLTQIFEQIRQGQEQVFIDFDRALTFAAVIRSGSDTPVAILITSVNPNASLATLSALWPISPPVGQIELLRGQLHKSPDSSLTATEAPIIRLRAVPGTSWTVKVSQNRAVVDDVLYPLAVKTGGISLLIVAFILMIAAFVHDRARRMEARKQALPQAHDHFRGTFEQVAVGLAYTDAECRILKTNAKLCEMLGKTSDALIGVTFKSLHLTDGRSDQSDHLRALLDGTQHRLELDKPYLSSAEKLVWFHITISLFFHEDGSAGYFIWVFEDITRRHEAEESLLASESIYKALFEHSPVALIEQDYSEAVQIIKELKARGIEDIPSYLAEDTDRLGNLAALVRITLMNQDAQKLLGIVPGSEMPESLFSHYLPESYPVFIRQLNSLLDDSVQVREEMPLMTMSGQSICTLSHLAILPGYKKDYRRGLVSLMDITERQQTEQRLLSLNAELESRVAVRTAQLMDTAAEQHAIFESVFSGIYLLKNWHIVRCNQRLGEIYGYRPEEMVGQTVGIFHPDTESFRAAQAYYDLTGQGETVRFDVSQIRKDGTALFCRVSGRLLEADAPEKGSVWVVEDITQEHQMTEDLLIAKNSAEMANRSKNTFLANIGHEIRTPLNAILGYSHLLQNDLPEWRHRDKLKRISVAAQHLLEIVNDIQDISKIEAGKLTVDNARFSLDETLSMVYNLVVEQADGKGLEIISDIAPELSTDHMGDALRLGQILLNLLSNAVKFTHEGFIQVKATSVPGTDSLTTVMRVEVTDTGVGIEPEAQGRLFRPFEQADDSINRQFGGTGLGLALSRGLVQMMGGQIGLWSTPGKGSTFWFTLPLKACVDVLYSGYSMKLPKPVRGLLVDDQPLARAAVGRLLVHLGVAVDNAESGVAALECLAEADAQGKPYELAIIDCKMPGMTGIELINRIDQRYRDKKPLCLLMLTTLTDCAQQAGYFLTKPITLTGLGETLVRVMKETTQPKIMTTVQTTAIPTDTDEHPHTDQSLILLNSLEKLLSSGDIQASRLYQANEKILNELLGGRAQEFAYLMNKYDFDDALTVLQTAVQSSFDVQ